MGELRRHVVVGTGAIAHAHASAVAAQLGRAAVTHAVDLDAARAKEFAERHGIAGWGTELAEALVDRPDLVHVCTPPDTHVPLSVQCLEAGVPVLLEKPPALSLGELDELLAASERTGVDVAVVFQHRFGAAGQRLRALLDDGTLGRPLVATCDTLWFRSQDYFESPWHRSWEASGGGPTMGHGIHQFDLLLSLLGPWTEVTAMAGRLARDTETEDVSTALVRFDSGALATVANSLVSPRETSELRIDTERATVEVAHLYGYVDDDWSITPAPGQEAVLDAWRRADDAVRSSHEGQLAAVLDAMDAGAPLPVPLREARDTLELVAAIYASAFTGRLVSRGEIGPGHPFYTRMQGSGALWGTGASAIDPQETGMTTEALIDRREGLSLRHDVDESILVAHEGCPLLTYVYAPDDVQLEAPRPYFHPIHTRGGDLVSTFRPDDHVWHRGIAWSLPNVGPHNFWGGPTYVHGQSYVQLDNVGSMDHERFTALTVADERVHVAHELVWRTQPRDGQDEGDAVVAEQRAFTVTVPADDAWVLTFTSSITNVSSTHLDIGSPTTKGRENAGYGGLFWRGPRSFTGGTILAPGVAGGDEVRGARAAWMGLTGQHDETARRSTVVIVDDSANPQHPPQWHVRAEEFACLNPAPFFSEEVAFPPGASLVFRYAVVVADGDADPARAEQLAEVGRATLAADAAGVRA